MKVVIQRVARASVTVDSKVIGEIGNGLLLLVGLGQNDDGSNFERLVQKIINLRIFADEKQKFMFSLLDRKAELLVVPQFTLFADTSKGRRPEFFTALAPDKARPLFEKLVSLFQKASPAKVAQGEFGAHMLVSLENDGPVTIILDE